ncbi:MAG: hypothetical protein FWD79_00150 [Desulfobulbus sp.]|nr:hypothetical protein [Desulfobulbus sp.]
MAKIKNMTAQHLPCGAHRQFDGFDPDGRGWLRRIAAISPTLAEKLS